MNVKVCRAAGVVKLKAHTAVHTTAVSQQHGILGREFPCILLTLGVFQKNCASPGL